MEDRELEKREEERARELYELGEFDEHVCDFSADGECSICGAIRYGSPLYREIYGGE